MAGEAEKRLICQICKEEKAPGDVLPAAWVREPVAATIRKAHPAWSESGYICFHDLNRFRAQYVQDVLELEKGELSALEMEVVRSLKEQEVLSRNLNEEFARDLTLGERLADNVAAFGGSWRFITFFFIVLVLWISLNSTQWLWRPFDPYPFILLNLILSCLAAIQAPIIMMSQNRQEARDRLRSEHDYRVDLKAELEIRNLNGKIDLLLTHQWQRLLEIQRIQIELMEEIIRQSPRRQGSPDSPDDG